MDYQIKLLNNDPSFNIAFMDALSWDDNHSWILDSLDQDSLFWDIEDMRFSSYIYGLYYNDELIGLSLINFDCDDNNNIYYDYSIIIKPQYRNKGIGLFFASQVLDIANKRFKINRISAHIMNDNISSISLFSKLGFIYKDKEDNINVYDYIYPKVTKKKAIS